jgi:hypothetical protein
MRAILVALLLLAPGGCIERLRGLEPEPPVATTLPWALSGCTFVVAIVPVPAARLDGRLPEGFRALAPAEIGLPADPRGDANVGVEAWRCAEGTGANASELLNDVPYGAVFSFVEPPADRVVNGSRYHFVKWDVLVPDEARRAILLAHGVPAQAGDATFPQFQPVADKTLFDVSLDLNGTWTMRGTTANPDASLLAFSFAEFTPTPHGLATWTTNVTAQTATSGTGTLASTAGFFREVVGNAQTQAYYIAGTGGAFENGTITLPPIPLD